MKNQDFKKQNNNSSQKSNAGSTQSQTQRINQPNNSAQNITSQDPIADLSSEIQRELKRRGDTAVHQAVLENDVNQLKELLKRGMPVFNPSDADGGTPLHRAAESCAIECAKVLLEKNADIDALNSMGQTPFHVSAEKQDFIFGKFLLKNRARRNCRPGCIKCRLFMKQIERYDKNQRDLEQQEKEHQQEEQKVKDQKKKQKKKNKNQNKDEACAADIDLLQELQRCREEIGGPFFDKKENQKFKEQQEQIRLEEEVRQQQMRQGRKQRMYEQTSILTKHTQSNKIDIPHITQLLSNAIIEIDQIKPQNRILNTTHDKFTHQEIYQKDPSTITGEDLIRNQKIKESTTQSSKSQYQILLMKAQKEQGILQKFQNLTIKDHQVPPPRTFYQSHISDSQQADQQIGEKQKRPKRIEDLEEEKKANKSNDSISYLSDGEIQHSYL